MLFKLSNLNSNLSLSLGYLNPALNNSPQVIFQMAETPLTGKGKAILLREVYMYIFPLVLISSRSTYTHIVVLELNFIFLLLLLAHFYLTQLLFGRFLQFQDKFAPCRNNDSKCDVRSSLISFIWLIRFSIFGVVSHKEEIDYKFKAARNG